MPDKNFNPRCGKGCLRCWQNKLKHANKVKNKNKNTYKNKKTIDYSIVMLKNFKSEKQNW